MRGRLCLMAVALAAVLSAGAEGQVALTLADGGVAFGDGSMQVAAGADPVAPVAMTGQRMCNETAGSTEIPCTGSGQDGELRKGVKWPFPRFTKNGDGTVTDHATGLVWLEDLNCWGYESNAGVAWSVALSLSANLYDGCTTCGAGGVGDCGLSDESEIGDWRLPSVTEMLSLGHYEFANSALPDTSGVGQWSSGDPFVITSGAPWSYWTSTTLSNAPSLAINVAASNAWTVGSSKLNGDRWVWPVRDAFEEGSPPVALTIDGGIQFPDGSIQSTAAGGPPARPVKTGQTTIYGTGDDGALQNGVAWPSPRLTDNGDGTVTDNLTGLVWLEDAGCFGSQTWSNALAKAAALYDGCAACGGVAGDCGLSDGSNPLDWRLPSLNEFRSLIAYGFNPAIPNAAGTGPWVHDDPFVGLSADGFHWTSTNYAPDLLHAWVVQPRNGNSGQGLKTSAQPVWLVRGGR